MELGTLERIGPILLGSRERQTWKSSPDLLHTYFFVKLGEVENRDGQKQSELGSGCHHQFKETELSGHSKH